MPRQHVVHGEGGCGGFHPPDGQRGGTLLGEGGDGAVFTLDDLPPAPVYALDLVDLKRGTLQTQYHTRESLLERYGLRTIVFKRIRDSEDNGATQPAKHPVAAPAPAPARTPPPLPPSAPVDGLSKWLSKWARPAVADVERSTWNLVEQRAGVVARMPLHFDDTYNAVLLDIRANIAGRRDLYPVYRFMHGSVDTLSWYYDLRARDIMDVAAVVLDTLAHLKVAGGYHHGDIKLENVLFRVHAKGASRVVKAASAQPMNKHAMHRALARSLAKQTPRPIIEYVVTDYAIATAKPSTSTIRAMRGTPGYMCPLLYSTFETFDEDARPVVRSSFAVPVPVTPATSQPSPALVTRWLWDSYRDAMALYAAGQLTPDAVLEKNDLYGLGMSLLSFSWTAPAAAMASLGLRLVRGETDALWGLKNAQAALAAIGRATSDAATSEPVDYIIRRRLRLMNELDAGERL